MSAEVRLALNAMNTRFELVLHGDNEPALRAAGEEALREIARIEDLLSAFRSTSEIAVINARAGREPVQVSPEVFALFQEIDALHTMTGGAFDITIGPLMRCWGLWGTMEGRVPTDSELRDAREHVGWQHVILNASSRTVQLARPGMTLDLGGIGKGYALDRAAELLRDQGVTSAFLHGGTSSVIAMGRPPGQSSWKTALLAPEDPDRGSATRSSQHFQTKLQNQPGCSEVGGLLRLTEPRSGRSGQFMASDAPATLELVDEALSVSSISTKAFEAGGRVLGHVLDPRSGEPVERARLAAVVLPVAAQADALSTALLVLGCKGLDALKNALPGLRGLVIGGSAEAPEMNAVGLAGV